MATLNDAGIDASIIAAAESSLPKKASGSWRSGLFSRKRRQSEDKKRSEDSEADAKSILAEDAADRSAEVTVHAGDEVPEDAKALARKLSEALGREVSVAEVLERRMAAAPAAALAVAQTMTTDVALALAPAPSRPRSGKALWQKAQTRRASIAAMSHQFSHRAKEKAAVGLAEAGVANGLRLSLKLVRRGARRAAREAARQAPQGGLGGKLVASVRGGLQRVLRRKPLEVAKAVAKVPLTGELLAFETALWSGVHFGLKALGLGIPLAAAALIAHMAHHGWHHAAHAWHARRERPLPAVCFVLGALGDTFDAVAHACCFLLLLVAEFGAAHGDEAEHEQPQHDAHGGEHGGHSWAEWAHHTEHTLHLYSMIAAAVACVAMMVGEAAAASAGHGHGKGGSNKHARRLSWLRSVVAAEKSKVA